MIISNVTHRVLYMSLIRISTLVLIICQGGNASPRTPSFSLDDIKDSIVIIESDQSTASGFVSEIDGNRYILTNQHVLLGASNVKFTTLSGVRLTPTKVELSLSRDVVRLAITGEGGLSLVQGIHEDDDIVVLGNSQGLGVATWIEGKILQTWKDRFEVSAEFVEGNSGSPIFNYEGDVCGVATYAVRYAVDDTSDIKANFVPQTHRMAYRLDGIQWMPVKWKSYNERYGDSIAEIDQHIEELYDIFIKWVENPCGKILIERSGNNDINKWIERYNDDVIGDLDDIRNSWRFDLHVWGEKKRLKILNANVEECGDDLKEIINRKIKNVNMIKERTDKTLYVYQELEVRINSFKSMLDYTDQLSRYTIVSIEDLRPTTPDY